MTTEERAALNRRAAELAGWTFRGEWRDPSGTAYWLPDFTSDPALWWPLVERVLRQVFDWKGPLYDSREPACWYVVARGELITGESPGEVAVRGVLQIAAALGET